MRKKSSGFTIIEITIVLAVAGLLLSAVLLASKQLKQSERNTKRKNMMHAVAAALEEFYINNKCYPQQSGYDHYYVIDLNFTGAHESGCGPYTPGGGGWNISSYLPAPYSKTSTNSPDPSVGYESNGLNDPSGGTEYTRECYWPIDKNNYLLWYVPEPRNPYANYCKPDTSTSPPSVPAGGVQVKI